MMASLPSGPAKRLQRTHHLMLRRLSLPSSSLLPSPRTPLSPIVHRPSTRRRHQHMLAIDGWLLHVARQPDGSLRLHFEHESCGSAAVSASADCPNEVVLRCSGGGRRCVHEVSCEKSASEVDSISSEDEEVDDDDVEVAAPPTTASLESVESAESDVAQSVVSTLLTSLTSDQLHEAKSQQKNTATRPDPERRSKKRVCFAEDEEEEEEHMDEDEIRRFNDAAKRRKRWRGGDVRSALPRSPSSPSSSTSTTSSPSSGATSERSSAIIDPTLAGMPAEIQLHILQLVPMLDLLRTLPLVSRQWNELARDDGLWRALKAQYFGGLRSVHPAFMLPPCGGPPMTPPSFRDQCIGFLSELKVLQQKHHRRLYEEERSYRQHQLIWGCSGGHSSFVHDLFRYHDALLDVNMLSASGNHAERTPLMVAVAAGNDDVAAFLLLEKRADVNRATSDGSTPLMIAASKGHKNAVQFLLDQRAEVNRITKNGCSALMLAALAGHEEIAALLLERGANPCGKTVDGSTALMIAVSKGNRQIVHSLLEHTPANRRYQVVNETRKDGWTALMIASTKGEEELVRVLVEHGAEVNKRKTGDGCTALMFAAAKGHTEIVRFLLSHNADVNTRNRDGWSALMIAADWGHKGCVEVFIEHKHLFTANGHPFGRVNLRMALIVSFMKKYYDIFSLLLQVGPQ